MAQSALNGYFERVRRLFRLVGVSDVPAGVMPVVIAGDSREPFATETSYREFGLSAPEVVGPLGAGAIVKWRFDSDCVITRVYNYNGSGATSTGGIYLATAADVIADAAAAYTPASAAVSWGAFAHRPEAGAPPASFATNGASPIGRRLAQTPRVGAVPYAPELGIYMPAGTAIAIVGPTAGTNWYVNIEGYVAR
jgi:hypothetical protein